MRQQVSTRSLIVTGIITFIVALAFIMFPKQIINLLGYITGIVLMVVGIFNVVMYFMHRKQGYSFGFTLGLILFSFGLYLAINIAFIMSAITVIFGFYILINGIVGLQFSLDAYMAKVNTWKFTVGMAIINLILGCIILYNPFQSTEILVMYIGIFMAVTAILSIVTVFLNKNQYRITVVEDKDETIM